MTFQSSFPDCFSAVYIKTPNFGTISKTLKTHKELFRNQSSSIIKAIFIGTFRKTYKYPSAFNNSIDFFFIFHC